MSVHHIFSAHDDQWCPSVGKCLTEEIGIYRFSWTENALCVMRLWMCLFQSMSVPLSLLSSSGSLHCLPMMLIHGGAAALSLRLCFICADRSSLLSFTSLGHVHQQPVKLSRRSNDRDTDGEQEQTAASSPTTSGTSSKANLLTTAKLQQHKLRGQ